MTDKIDDNALLERMNRDWPKRPVFKDKLQEREWSKFRLAQAYRIFSMAAFHSAVEWLTSPSRW